MLSRFLGTWLVAATLVAAVVDGAKSIAASRLVFTPFGETWTTLTSLTRSGADATEPAPLPWPLDIGLVWLLTAPTVAVLALLGFLFLSAGRRRARPLIGREFTA